MAFSSPSVVVLERSQVSPPLASVAESSLPLTFFDVLWLRVGPVDRVFLFPFPYSTSHFTNTILPAFKSSLSLALQHFYPLAGKIRRSPDCHDEYEIRFVDGDSVSLTVAEHRGGDFDDLSGSHARDVSMLLPLVPRLAKRAGEDGSPVLAVQVTLFPDRGVALGAAVHHAACDGTGSTHFLASWAAACRSALSIDEEVAAPPPPPPPVFDEAAVAAATRGLYTYIAHMLPSRDVAEEEKEYEEASDAVIATFTLRQEQIGPLKQLVQAKAAEEGKTPTHCSTVVVAYALAWVCHVRARGHPSHKTAHFGFTASCRGRLTPPAPDSYFGNCILPCIAEAKVEDLVGPDGFVAAAQAVGRAVDEFKSSDVMRCMERWREKIPAVMAEGAVVTVAGSPRFKVYHVDFGWGRPKKVDLMTIRKSRAISLADSREEEGGVEIGVVLPKSEMDEFGNHFISGLESNVGCKFDC